jgi:hypothetical protein
MYTSCLFCSSHLGRNDMVPTLPIGQRLAFDPARGRLWVICRWCERWNLVPIEERWEAVEECERLFRGTRLRFSTPNVGLAYIRGGLALVRIGPALKPEIAAWRYGGYLNRWLPAAQVDPLRRVADGVTHLADRGAAMIAVRMGLRRDYDLAMWVRLKSRPGRVVATVETDRARLVIRARHLEACELVRPDPGQGWQLKLAHDRGVDFLAGDQGLGAAGKLLARLNGGRVPDATVRYAVAKLEDAGNPDGYFARVAAIAMRHWWGRFSEARPEEPVAVAPAATESERLALHLTKRSFWGRGGFGSEPATPLPRLPLVDRLALEMAANEDTERRVMEGELALLERAWREAEELAAISDKLLLTPDRSIGEDRTPGRFAPA